MRSSSALLLTALVLSTAGTSAASAAPGALSVRAEIRGLKNTSGKLYCALYDAAAGWPETGGVARQVLPITGKDAVCTFEGLAAGTYAVTVFHDANGNGKMDYGMLGAPTEGWGSSNGVTHTFSGPTFEESSFPLRSDLRLTIELHDE